MNWMEGPDMPTPRADHCSVQVGNCKGAVIGGTSGPGPADPFIPFIEVYDFEDGHWYEGPR